MIYWYLQLQIPDYEMHRLWLSIDTSARRNDGANHVIYANQLISDPSTENRPLLQSLLVSKPLNFEYNNKSFHIRSTNESAEVRRIVAI